MSKQQKEPINPFKRIGITQIQPKEGYNVLSYIAHQSADSDENRRLDKVMQEIQGVVPFGDDPVLDYGFKSITGLPSSNLYESVLGMQDIQNGNDPVILDIETLGQSKRMAAGQSTADDLYAVTQISLLNIKGKTAKDINPKDAEVISLKLRQKEYKKLNFYLDEIERNPSFAKTLDQRTKETIADLSLYRDEKIFSVRDGVTFQTGQSATKPQVYGDAFTSSANIAGYRKGLQNLQQFGTSENSAYDYLYNYMRKNNATFIGHNVTAFDKKNLIEYIKASAYGNKKGLIGGLSQPWVDTIIGSRALRSNTGNLNSAKPQTYQLSNILNDMGAVDMDLFNAHFAGDDTAMNAYLYLDMKDELTSAIPYNNGKRGRKNKKSNAQFKNINIGDTFYVDKGLPTYNKNGYNKVSQYDTNFRTDSKTGKLIQNYSFQESGLVSGHEVVFKGYKPGVDIEGVDHVAIMFEDLTSGTNRIMFRNSESDFNDMFNQNLVSKNNISKSKVQFHKDDKARRFYEGLFSSSAFDGTHDVAKEINRSYATIQDYYDELKAMGVKYPERASQKKQKMAMTRIWENANRDAKPESQFLRSYDKIEKTINSRHRLLQEEPFWKKVIADAQGTAAGATGDAGIIQQNIYINAMKDQFDKHVDNPLNDVTENYKYEGMQRYKVPTSSNPGEFTYFNIESFADFKSSVNRTLFGGNKTAAMAEQDMDKFISNMGGHLSDDDKNQILATVRKEMRTRGNVSPRKKDAIFNKLYSAARLDKDNIVAEIPGTPIRKVFTDGSSERQFYINNLSSKENELYKEMTEQATKTAYRRLNTSANPLDFNLDQLSNPVQQKIKRAQEVADTFDRMFLDTQKVHGLNKNPRDILRRTDHTKEIQRVINAFSQGDFNFSVDYGPQQDALYLFFSQDKSAANLFGKSFNEKLFDDKLGRVTLPMGTDDFLVNINGQAYQNRKIASPKSLDVLNPGKADLSVKSLNNVAYDELVRLPEKIKNIQEDHRRRGTPISNQEATEIAISSYDNKMRERSIPGRFPGSGGEGFKTGSAQKNLQNSLIMDIGDVVEDVFATTEKESYQRFQSWKKKYKKPDYLRYVDSDFTDDMLKENPSLQRQRLLSHGMSVWNNAYGEGTNYGLQALSFGVNGNQFRRGNVAIGDLRGFTVGGSLNSASREQILKTPNYHAMNKMPLDTYTKRVLRSKEAQQRILEPIRTDVVNNAMHRNDGLIQESGVSALLARTYFTDDFEINQRISDVSKKYQIELDGLMAKTNKTSDDKNRITKLTAAIKTLKSGILTVNEEQSVLRQSLADAMNVSDNLHVSIDEGYELNGKLKSAIESQLETQDIKSGSYKFDKVIAYKDMKGMGILDGEDMLTVGEIAKESITADGKEQRDVRRQQKQRIYKESVITGFSKDENGNIVLDLHQKRKMKSGSKVFDAMGSGRQTGVVVDDFVFDAVFGKNTDWARENIKLGRNPYGAMLGTLVQTNYLNAMEDFDNVLSETADGKLVVNSAKAKLTKTQDWLADNADRPFADAEELRRAFTKEALVQDIENAGYTGLVQATNKDVKGSFLEFKYFNDVNAYTGGAGKDAYDALYDMSVAGYGFNEKNAVTQLAVHDVVEWTGEGTKATYSVREFEMLDYKVKNALYKKRGNKDFKNESVLMNSLLSLTDTNMKQAHLDYGRELNSSLDLFDKNFEATKVEGQNNVVIDYSGGFTGSGNVEVRKGADGSEYLAVNPAAVKRPDSRKPQLGEQLSTTADFMSVYLDDGPGGQFDSTLTIGDWVRMHESQAVAKLQDPNKQGNRPITRNYIPIVSQMEGAFEEEEIVNQRQINKNISNITNRMNDLQDIQFAPDTTPAQQSEILDKLYRGINANITDLQANMNSHLSGSGKSGFVKGTMAMKSTNGFSAKAGAFNLYDDTHRADTVYMSAGRAEALVIGQEDAILAANNITQIGDKDISILKKADKREHILKQLADAESDFEMIGVVNRFPTQSQGSLNFSRMKIDSNLEDTDRLMINPGLAKLLGADYDGDVIYMDTSAYGATNGKDIAAYSKELITVADYNKVIVSDIVASEKAKLANKPANGSFATVRQWNAEEAHAFMLNTSDKAAQELDHIKQAKQIPGIGVMDNQMVASRNLLATVSSELYDADYITGASYNQIMNNWDEQNDVLVQNYISAKKLQSDILDTPEMNFADMNAVQQQERALQIMADDYDVPGKFRTLTTDNIDETLDFFAGKGLIGAEEGAREKMRTAFIPLAVANEATASKHGSSNYGLRLGRSLGFKDALEVKEVIEQRPGQLIDTPNMRRYVEGLYEKDSEVYKNYIATQEIEKEFLVNNVDHVYQNLLVRETVSNPDTTAKIIEEQLNLTSALAEQSTSSRRVISQNRNFNAVKDMLSSTANSMPFKAAAGVSAMWMLSSAIRKGPTPEGAEAEQEASTVEVNPSALLTSPTARVTPKGENISLTISGTGNLNEEAVAGIINNELNTMMGSTMNMNVTVNDNTQTLDRSFYEQQVNQVLGL